MLIDYIPLLSKQHELYEVPRGWDRFRQYLEVMQPGTDDQFVPMFVMNPMAKEHVTARLDELLALDADGIAQRAGEKAALRLPLVSETFKAGMILADDLQGGWTNRYLSEAQIRYGYTLSLQRRARAKSDTTAPWVIGMMWVSEPATRQHVEWTIQVSVYRAAYLRQHGYPTTLRQMLIQEGLALIFADAQPAALDHDELEYSREVIRVHLDTADFPVAFACIYGDPAASEVGYPPLGLSAGAGFAVAYHSLLDHLARSGQTVETALLDDDAQVMI